nr:MAG TPA: hypothetical protein [Inoviridae sp.]
MLNPVCRMINYPCAALAGVFRLPGRRRLSPPAIADTMPRFAAPSGSLKTRRPAKGRFRWLQPNPI